MTKIIERHDGIFYLFSKKCLLEKSIELDPIEFPNDEYIHNIVGRFIAEVEYRIRDRHEIESFASLEELLHGLHHVIRLHEHLDKFRIDRTIMIHLIVLFLVLFIRFQDSKCFKIHEFTPDCIDLFIHITTELTNKKTRTRSSHYIFDDEFFKEFDPRTRAEKFDEIHRLKI